MQRYNKALAAFVAAGVQLLANFGVTLPPEALSVINAAVPLIGSVLVYAVPNRDL